MVLPAERAQAIQNFKIEAKILWGLNHPNLPTFSGFFSENQRYFLVMEYVDGTTLEKLLDRSNGPFPERRVLGWARQLCDVLEYLHSQNPPIIFRDMKPGNIMLTRDGQIKLIDFGIARFFRSSGGHDTQLLGTPGFAPLEQYGKAQTDERSDIYSLAMTLFQLLTDTLSETEFGLEDIRAINPRISPMVARALEKAASKEADDRYDNVADFRRALLGRGTFFFENGDQATTPDELAELCARYPEEASDYLADGEIESWLYEIGEVDLARVARNIRTMISDPQEAIERFLQAIIGPSMRLRNRPKTQASPPNPPVSQNSLGNHEANDRDWLPRKATSPVQVSPRTLDFGDVYPGISGPLAITLSGSQGTHISGTIHTSDPWIMLEQTEFDSMITRINVRINSTALHHSTHYTGTILVSPDIDGTRDIPVIVEVNILSYTQNGWRRRGGKTIGADLDEEDDEEGEDDDSLTMGNITPISSSSQVQLVMDEKDEDASSDPREREYRIKYGDPNRTAGIGWDPLKATRRQRRRLQHGAAFVAAMMGGSMSYTLLTPIVPLLKTPQLSSSPWFILVLCCLIPTTTLGALLVNRDNPWTFKDAINHACSGMMSVLLVSVLVKLGWQLFAQSNPSSLEFILMLVITALGATFGTFSFVSDYIVYGTSWLLAQMRKPVIVLSAIIGAGLGYLFTLGFAFSFFTFFGPVMGAGVALALALRVDYLMKQSYP